MFKNKNNSNQKKNSPELWRTYGAVIEIFNYGAATISRRLNWINEGGRWFNWSSGGLMASPDLLIVLFSKYISYCVVLYV